MPPAGATVRPWLPAKSAHVSNLPACCAHLVAQAPTRDMNPLLPQSVIDRALERDAAKASAEYLVQFRSDLETFIQAEAVGRCVDVGVSERPYDRKWSYVAFTDPSGGSGGDSFTLAIAHKENQTAVLDLVRETRPPFSPEGVISNYAAPLRDYRVFTVTGDRYAGEFPREQFSKHGVTYEPSELTKSEIYKAALPMINSRAAALIENPTLQRQFLGLERRVAWGGKDSIDHGPGGRDDLANAAAGALVMASKDSAEPAWLSRSIRYPKGYFGRMA